jgi:hypothetical protein
MSDWILRRRLALYVIVNAVVALGAVLTVIVHGTPIGRPVYGAALFAICSAPLPLLRTMTSRYVLLALFMGTYFLHFGAMDLQYAFFGGDDEPRASFLTPAEGAALLGGLLAVLGYRLGELTGRRALAEAPATEWPIGTLLGVGLVLWAIGTGSIFYNQVFIIPEKTNEAVARGLTELGAWLTFLMLLLQLLQPLGLLMLAYGYARRRGVFWTSLIVTVVVLQIAVGFVTDVKATALMAGLVVVVTRLLVDRKVPTAWMAASIAFLVFAFPVFQAYRMEVEGARGLNRTQAFLEFDKVLQIALSASERAQPVAPDERAQTFIERAYVKDNLAAVMQHVGVDVPFLGGSSLVALPMAFVPRILAPDKESVSVGQLFSTLIAKGDRNTYISISHLGEMYWNFGWPGMVVGMLLTGLCLGAVGVRSALEHGTSMTRLMLLMGTFQTLCIGFEGEISTSYVVWMRSLAAIALLHLLFARRTHPEPVARVESRNSAGLRALPRFPNVMR